MNDLQNDEWLTYREPCDGTILFSGWRRAPDGDEEVLFIGTMEGAATEVVPVEHVPADKRDGWSIALASPGIDIDAPDETISLGNSEAILLTR
jgi:hypothetical protein